MLYGDIDGRQGGGGGGMTTTVIEDWESGSIPAAWTVDSSGFTVVNDATLEGSFLLENDGGFNRLWSFEGDGLPVYPSRGSEIRFLSHLAAGSEYVQGIYYGVGDASNNYFTRHIGGNFELVKKIDGANTPILQLAGSFPSGDVVEWSVVWDDGTLGGNVGDHHLTVTNLDTDTVLAEGTVNSTAVRDNGFSDPSGLGVWNDEADTAQNDYLRHLVEDPSVTVISDFETDLSAWSNSTGSFAISAGYAQHGDSGLEHVDSGYAQIDSQPGDGLNYYPEQGDAFEWYTFTGANFCAPVWGAPSLGDSTYYLRPRADNNELELVTAGTSHLGFTTVETDTWYKCRVEWDDGNTFGGSAGDMNCYMYDLNDNELATVSANDTTSSSGGVGVGGVARSGLDYWRKTN